MGLCQSEEDKKQSVNSRNIDKILNEGYLKERKIVKLLLLGAAECGKTTILKQMKILHAKGFNEEELHLQRAVVYTNMIDSMGILIKAMKEFDITFENIEREKDARLILGIIRAEEESEPLSDEIFGALKRLWADEAVSIRAYSRRYEINLHESSKYFFDNLDRICTPDYKITDQDFLHTRIKTTGIVETFFEIKKMTFRVIDVGGQRSERKKWIHCFEHVNAIIFITAISEYDELLAEDDTINRQIIESLRLFRFICNIFTKISMILFLNKKDLFEEKICLTSIRTAFLDYEGHQTYHESIDFIKKKFDSVNDDPKKKIYKHETCATDTNQVKQILDSVVDLIISTYLKTSGLK